MTTQLEAEQRETAQEGVGHRYLARADREVQIVERAIELFAQKGFALTTRELAQGLEVTQPLLYRYFPSKGLLIERVYEQVFLRRFNPEWENWLSDRSTSLEDRLITYFKDYTRVILNSSWVRIFLYAGLQDPAFNQRYLRVLDEKVLKVVIRELRRERGSQGVASAESEVADNELVWGLHSSFFYMGVRKWVYQLPVPDDLDVVIPSRVRAFLSGALSDQSSTSAPSGG